MHGQEEEMKDRKGLRRVKPRACPDKARKTISLYT